MDVSDVQWRALALTVARADGRAATHVVDHEPHGDAAVARRTAAALAARRFVTIEDTTMWPTPHGRRALALHHRLEARRASAAAATEANS